jgi:uncharacterized repeat protein (TIGR03803 family)
MMSQPESSVTGLRNSVRLSTFALSLLCALTMIAPQLADAQTYTVLHNFTGSNDGALPSATLTMDEAGNLYGTAAAGGFQGAGTVFKLTNRSSGWLLTTLYSFTGGEDGGQPRSSVIFGPAGRLYGNTYAGGNPICSGGCGTIYSLRPQPRACASANCSWQETTLYQFSAASDGEGFPWGSLLFDAAGNIYGTTIAGAGIVYKLSPGLQGWSYQIAYSFDNGGEAYRPYAGVISDTAGNLLGTTYGGGNDNCYRLQSCGTVFELSPVGSSWVLTIIHDFDGNDGGLPIGGLISDRFGNLYGANSIGVIYRLTPNDGSWSFNTLATVQGRCQSLILGPSCGPWDTLAMGADGSLYGTAYALGVYGYGSVFRLTPSNGGWIYNDLHDFTNGSDGSYPIGGVTLDASGNLYGATTYGGSAGGGVVFEITQ